MISRKYYGGDFHRKVFFALTEININTITAVQFTYFLWAFASHPQMESPFSHTGWLCSSTENNHHTQLSPQKKSDLLPAYMFMFSLEDGLKSSCSPVFLCLSSRRSVWCLSAGCWTDPPCWSAAKTPKHEILNTRGSLLLIYCTAQHHSSARISPTSDCWKYQLGIWCKNCWNLSANVCKMAASLGESFQSNYTLYLLC